MKEKKDWFRLKRYAHIGFPVKEAARKKIENYITNPDNVAKHAFLPFIHRTSRARKFRKEYSKDSGYVVRIPNQQRPLRKKSEKPRELYYASHFDSLIFSYYAEKLSRSYEEMISQDCCNLTEEVNAYRSIPVDPKKNKNFCKCNIDFANDIFLSIIGYPHDEFSVLTFDISNFFDSINHKLLRERWSEIVGVEKLPKDHYNVYKNITRFSYVDLVDIFEEFKDSLYTEKITKKSGLVKKRRKSVNRICYLRDQNVVAFCTKKDFLKVKGKLLQPSKTKRTENGEIIERNFGIPQGSAISSVLSNVYLLHFDRSVKNFVASKGGIYRRYSDDMIVVCPLHSTKEIKDCVLENIQKCKLVIQETKTQEFILKRENNRLNCGQIFVSQTNWKKNITYLGFEFDGENVLLKSASLAGFYRKMKRNIKRAKFYANSKSTHNKGEIFKRRILKKFSYKGAKRIQRRYWSEYEKKFINTKSYNYGNFLTYAYKAAKIMKNDKIKNQTKRHWSIINKLLK